ncbi:MAG: VWA domain-containing protein [Candidatus Sericytochromatia bacterium]
MSKKSASLLLLSLFSSSLLTACGPSPTTTGLSQSLTTGSMASYSYGSGDTAHRSMPMPRASATPAPSSAPTAAPTSAPSSAPDSEPLPAASALPSETSSALPSAAASAPPDAIQARSGLLTAGSWRDLDHWDFWLSLTRKAEWREQLTQWQLYPTQRVPVLLRQGGQPWVDQPVQLKDTQGNLIAEARTNQAGAADFFVHLDGQNRSTEYQVMVPGMGLIMTDVQSQQGQFRAYTLNREAEPQIAPNQVDLMLSIDTTGSMGDELEYLKIELKNVLERVQRSQAQLNLRVSTNFYRDQGDEYLVKPFPFSSDFNQVQNQLLAQRAGGGGDFPEDVNAALKDAIQQHEWSASARARLLFLVLDAPPHRSESNLRQLKELLNSATRQGIRIIPIASSGVDKDTEFLMRMLAISTGGEYVFLTDDSGVGTAQGHIEPTIGAHKVEKLNDLMVNLVEKYTRIQALNS